MDRHIGPVCGICGGDHVEIARAMSAALPELLELDPKAVGPKNLLLGLADELAAARALLAELAK